MHGTTEEYDISQHCTNILCRPQKIFIKYIVELVRVQLAANFPECRLPMQDKVILYTISHSKGHGANRLVKKLLMGGNIVFEERNCSKEPKYFRELEVLVGNDKVRFPMLIVNGKDLCGNEVEGLYNYENKGKLISLLKTIYRTRYMKDMMRRITCTRSTHSKFYI